MTIQRQSTRYRLFAGGLYFALLAPLAVGLLQNTSFARVIGYISMSNSGNDPTLRGLHVVDLTDPANPSLIKIYQTANPTEILVQGDRAYLTRYPDGFELLDVSTPEDPSQILCYTSSPFDYCSQANGKDGYIYLARGSFGLSIFDSAFLADRLPVQTLPSYDSRGGTHNIKFLDNLPLAVVGDGRGGVEVVNISDPANASLVGRTDWAVVDDNNIYHVDVAYPYVYACIPTGLKIVDISNPSSPQTVNAFGGSRDWWTYDIQVVGRYGFMARCNWDLNNNDGLFVLDLQNPVNPVAVASVPIATPTRLTVVNSVAYVCDGYGGLSIVDVSNPLNPTKLGVYAPQSTYPNGSYAIGAAVIVKDPPQPGAVKLLHGAINPENGHYYEVYYYEAAAGTAPTYNNQITWEFADASAKVLNYQETQGHLATVTSAVENAWIANEFKGFFELYGGLYSRCWLGGYQDPVNSPRTENWKWVTGEDWTSYINWTGDEPNDTGGTEAWLQMVLNGIWNDGPYMPSPAYPGYSLGWCCFGYLVEYDLEDPEPLAVTLIAPLSGSVYPANAPVTVEAAFTDGCAGPHSFEWKFDGVSVEPMSQVITEPSGENPGSVTAVFSFAAAGVYRMTLTVGNDCGADATADQIGGMEVLIVVYDPTAGFLTGGGWIESLPGAYLADPTVLGRANFGFVSKFQKGASVPTGQTEFRFKMADLDFHSTSYEWLVVAGGKAQYKGSGQINCTGNYGFLLTATDGQLKGGNGLDMFRIKIWDKNAGGAIVYDNVSGASDDIDNANPQVISGGNILIHK